MKGSAIRVLKRLNINPRDLRIIIENKNLEKIISEILKKTILNLRNKQKEFLRNPSMEQKNLDENEIKTIHVLLAILLDENNIVTSSP